MIVVFLALLMGLGVMFGMQALVVDLGFGMGQQGAMQNAADAGALAAAKLMAGSVSDSAGGAVYALTDTQVHQAAFDLASANFAGGLGSSSHAIAVQYLACPGQTDGTPNFSAQSDPDLLAYLVSKNAVPAGSVRLPANRANAVGVGSAPNWTWPSPICRVRVYAVERHGAMFARALPSPPSGPEWEFAKATARIYPTTPPTDITDVWPITHWLFNDTSCVFQAGSLCTFWDSNSPPGGNFKEVVDLSRYSELAKSSKPTIKRSQLLGQLTTGVWSRVRSGLDLFCPFGSVIPCYDPANNGGNNGKLNDVPSWVANGWRGHLYVDELDPNCSDATKVVASCQNSRLELYGGDMGANISNSMLTYINTFSEGIDPSCNCKFASLVGFFWRYGEQNIQETCPSPPGSCVVDQGTVWGASANPAKESTTALQRIILQKARRFRFNTSTVSSSSVKGYYVSFYSTSPPINGTPSSLADTVGLVD